VKIISGGQTGVDRAALDVALKHGIDCGGWCPAGRLDELGRIPDRYPVKQLAGAGFAERTLQNVKESDGTVIICAGKLSDGTKQTVQFSIEQQRPHLLIDASKVSVEEAAKLIADFARKHHIRVLNVAGPRQSEWPEGYNYALRALDGFAKSIMSKSKRKFTRSAGLSPDRDARRSKRESARRGNRSETR
jgi:putative molybdenum carrier protein